MYYNLYLTPYNLLLTVSMIGIAMVCAMVVMAGRIHVKAKRFLVVFLILNFLWLLGIIVRDINLEIYYPLIRFIPFNLSLVLGPSIYYYIRFTFHPGEKFKISDWIHFIPVMLQLAAMIVYSQEIRTDGLPDRYHGNLYEVLNPFIEVLTLISLLFYLRKCQLEIATYNSWLEMNYSNSAPFSAVSLLRDVRSYGLAWLLWLPFTAYDYLLHNYELPARHYYAIYLLIACCTIWIGLRYVLKPVVIPVATSNQWVGPTENVQELPDKDTENKTGWLTEQIRICKYYLDPDLSLRVLSDELDIHHNTLTRLINKGSGKNFNDFINQFRIEAVKQKIADPAYAHLTIEAIAYESGFNSKSTFNRSFKKTTGTTPREYLRKLRPE